MFVSEKTTTLREMLIAWLCQKMSWLIPHAKPYCCPLVHMHPATASLHSLSKSLPVFLSILAHRHSIWTWKVPCPQTTDLQELPSVMLMARWSPILKFPDVGLQYWQEMVSVLFFEFQTPCLTHHAWKHIGRAHSKSQTAVAYSLQLQNVLVDRTHNT